MSSALSSPFRPLASVEAEKKRMSVTQTYFLAHKARSKLAGEARRSDHNLRFLVGHANLLDTLMLELADAERDQQDWFQASLNAASTPAPITPATTVPEAPATERRIKWSENIAVYEDSSSDSDDYLSSSDDESDEEIYPAQSSDKPYSQLPALDVEDLDDFDDLDDLEEDFAGLQLTRTTSHSQDPPELVDQDTDSSEDDMPSSPPAQVLEFMDSKTEQVFIETLDPAQHRVF